MDGGTDNDKKCYDVMWQGKRELNCSLDDGPLYDQVFDSIS